MTDTTSVIQTYVEAVIELLLGRQPMKQGIAILGGRALDIDRRLLLGQMAANAMTDLVHLEIGKTENGNLGITGVNIVMSRDGICYFQTDCRFWPSKSGNRALILRRPESRGHFRLSPRELIHIDGKPTCDVAGGIRRADDWVGRRWRGLRDLPS